MTDTEIFGIGWASNWLKDWKANGGQTMCIGDQASLITPLSPRLVPQDAEVQEEALASMLRDLTEEQSRELRDVITRLPGLAGLQ